MYLKNGNVVLAATDQATKTEEKEFRVFIIVNEPQFEVPVL